MRSDNPTSLNTSIVPVGMGSTQRYSGQGATEEQRLGQAQFPTPQTGRLQAPEDANADMANWDPSQWMKTADWQVPSILQIEGTFTVLAADFNVLANYQYVRAAADDVGSEGRNDQTTYPFQLTTAGTGIFQAGTAASRIFSTPNLVLGFQVEWGVNVLNFQPFNMVIQTFNFIGRSYQPLNRQITLRMGGSAGFKGGNSGIFQVLFGQRLTSSDTCGYTSTADSGMNKAIVQPAQIPALLVTQVPGISVASPADQPFIRLTVPVAVETGFGATLHLLSAASPYLGSMREGLYLDSSPE